MKVRCYSSDFFKSFFNYIMHMFIEGWVLNGTSSRENNVVMNLLRLFMG